MLKTLTIAAGGLLLTAALALYLFSPLFAAPSKRELIAAIEERYPTIAIARLDILEQRYYCPENCDASRFRNRFAGAGRISEVSYARQEPEQWVTACKLPLAAVAHSPLVRGKNGTLRPLPVYRPQGSKGRTFTFAGDGSTAERPDGSWDLGGYRVDFSFPGDAASGFKLLGHAKQELNGHILADSGAFKRLCALTAKSYETRTRIEGDWPPVSLVR